MRTKIDNFDDSQFQDLQYTPGSQGHLRDCVFDSDCTSSFYGSSMRCCAGDFAGAETSGGLTCVTNADLSAAGYGACLGPSSIGNAIVTVVWVIIISIVLCIACCVFCICGCCGYGAYYGSRRNRAYIVQ